MAITTTWTNPTVAVSSSGIDFATGDTIDEATLDRLVSNINRLGGADGNTKTGHLKMADQPSFLAYNSASDDNATGDGTLATVDFDTEVTDQGSDFAADTYTADVTGKHLLCGAVSVLGITGSMTAYQLRIVTSNRTYQFESSLSLPSGDRIAIPFVVIADMDATDTASVQISLSGGTLVGDIRGPDGGRVTTFFSGALLH